MSDRKEFESWLLGLNHDFDQNTLYRRKRGGKYFFTKVQALYEQSIEIAELKEEVGNLRSALKIAINHMPPSQRDAVLERAALLQDKEK